MARYFIAFWNLENLFAPEDFPDREERIRRLVQADLAGWSEALFRRKLERLATGIAAMAAGAGPDLLGVCEAENRFVLDQLAGLLNARLPARRYEVAHADAAQDRRGIDTAFLFDASRLTLVAGSIFSHFVIRRTGTRDILQATFATAAGNELVALANHWPSRSGGTLESAGFRATAGETLGYFHERIREVRGNDIAILAMGDFNDDPHDASLRFNALAWRERGDVERATTARFYNLAWRYLTQAVTDRRGDARVIDGTLYFGGDGSVFDQILVNRSLLNGERGLRVLDETARIEAFPAMVSHRTGEGPIRFGLPKGNPGNVNQDGFSDHFPVSVVLDEG